MDSDASAIAPVNRRKFRLFQFSLTTMFAVITLIAVWLGWEVTYIHQRKAWLRKNNGLLGDNQRGATAGGYVPVESSLLKRKAQVPFWREWLGDGAVERITFPADFTDRAEAERLFPEAHFFKVYLFNSDGPPTGVVIPANDKSMEQRMDQTAAAERAAELREEEALWPRLVITAASSQAPPAFNEPTSASPDPDVTDQEMADTYGEILETPELAVASMAEDDLIELESFSAEMRNVSTEEVDANGNTNKTSEDRRIPSLITARHAIRTTKIRRVDGRHVPFATCKELLARPTTVVVMHDDGERRYDGRFLRMFHADTLVVVLSEAVSVSPAQPIAVPAGVAPPNLGPPGVPVHPVDGKSTPD